MWLTHLKNLNQRIQNGQSEQRKYHNEPMRTQSENMQLPEARENARDQVAIGFRFGWEVSAGFLDKWHGVVNKNH